MNISVDDAIGVLQKELAFHKINPPPARLAEEFYTGFITGLEQAVFVLRQIKMDFVPEQKDGKSEV